MTTDDMADDMAGAVARALAELAEEYPGRVQYEPDGQGGAFVTVSAIAVGENWTHPTTSISMHVPYHYPAAAIYPYYLPRENAPHDAQQALQPVVWRGRNVWQLSLRHNQWSPQHDTLLGCIFQASSWMRAR